MVKVGHLDRFIVDLVLLKTPFCVLVAYLVFFYFRSTKTVLNTISGGFFVGCMWVFVRRGEKIEKNKYFMKR